MPAPANVHRSPERAAAIMFRCSVAEREALKQRARDEGVTVQTLMERALLGRPGAQPRPHGPRRDSGEELPIDVP
jgi:hypothetical protein